MSHDKDEGHGSYNPQNVILSTHFEHEQLENYKINLYLSRDEDKGMVFRYTWVYSKEDTMAHTRRAMVTS